MLRTYTALCIHMYKYILRCKEYWEIVEGKATRRHIDTKNFAQAIDQEVTPTH